jgi:hypothetical protein
VGKPGGCVGARANRKLGGGVRVGAGDGVGCVLIRAAKILASCWSAATWLSLVEDIREAGEGCWRAAVRSRAAAITRSGVEDAVGMAS